MKKTIPPLCGSADSLALAKLAKDKPLVVITASATSAERLKEEIAWFDPNLSVHRLPDWETLAYDQFSPHPDLTSERLATLYTVARGLSHVTIIPITTCLTRLCPKPYLLGRAFELTAKTKLDINQLRDQLMVAGYTHVQQVMGPGEFCVRGGLIDLFPTGSVVPYRIDLFDDEIETIRTFDIDTQRSIYPVKEVRLLPAREFPLDKSGQAVFRLKFRERFEGDPSKSRIYKDVSNGAAPAGIEYYLPLFFEETATIFDYLPIDAQVLLHHDVNAAAVSYWTDTKSRYNLLRGDKDRPLLEPKEWMLPVEDFFAGLKAFDQLTLAEPDFAQIGIDGLPPLVVDRRAEKPLAAIQKFLSTHQGRTLLIAESLGRRETISQFFGEHNIKPVTVDSWQAFVASDAPIAITVGPVLSGFFDSTVNAKKPTAIITENELYSGTVRQARRRDAKRATVDGTLKDLAEVKIGDPVVHEEHGIGRYQGLFSMDMGNGATEFMLLQYADGDKLYVPVSQLAAISRYTGANPNDAPVHKLGSGQWEKAKSRAQKAIRDTAAELLNLYAQRSARVGHAFTLDQQDYEKFSATFAFEETPDQKQAIEAVIADMTKGQPMDRLICGDVGFGKTEVAMRAAFVAVMGGKQVAILVPTTLLAEQHYKNFVDRFAEFPVKIAELSRFRSAKEISASIDGMNAGTVDIAIGTHRIVQKDVKFKNLGLVIIDEEHRFGVRHKEELKQLRAEVDVLTLTATPIPRTLALSLEGLREFSVIASPPQKRLSIKTFVARESAGVIREAVMRELKRGGQAYYLYNEVETIQNQYDRLAKLLPEARIAIAHGQLPERELERVMRDFYHQKANVLLCSTIIETGIDVPTANTILMHRADRFGLAQLHQLRGRVGRSHHQAYAYLLTPPEDAMSADAKRRLEAIQMMEDLGAGFYLAMHDLEIRGAGEVLGDSQSGGIQDVGFALYATMLNSAVASLKAGREPDLSQPLSAMTDINLHMPALLPADYCGDVHERLVIYKRLANCESKEEIDELGEELIDRFGTFGEQVRALVETHRLRVMCKPVGIRKIDASPTAIALQFIKMPPVEPHAIIHAVQTRSGGRISGPDKVRIEGKFEDFSIRVGEIKRFITDILTGEAPALKKQKEVKAKHK